MTMHMAATVWIAVSYRRSDQPLVLLAVSALPLAQASLLAAWAAGGRPRSYVRVPAAVVAATAAWAVECRALGMESADERCAAYALAFAVQVVLVGGVLAAWRLGRWLGRQGRDPADSARRLRFSIVFLLGWVTGIGVVLGAWRLVLARSVWPVEVVEGPLFSFGAAAGAYNAAFGLIMLAGVWWGRRSWLVVVRVLSALMLVGLLAGSQPFVLHALFGKTGNVDSAEWLVQAGFQAAYLLLSLVPLRRTWYDERQAGRGADVPRRQDAGEVPPEETRPRDAS